MNFPDFSVCSWSSYKQKDIFSIYSASKLLWLIFQSSVSFALREIRRARAVNILWAAFYLTRKTDNRKMPLPDTISLWDHLLNDLWLHWVELWFQCCPPNMGQVMLRTYILPCQISNWSHGLQRHPITSKFDLRVFSKEVPMYMRSSCTCLQFAFLHLIS